MESSEKILQRARSRAIASGLPYAGALLPREAHDLLRKIPAARLVDVRTEAEIYWVGFIPEALHVEWNHWPAGEQNENFIEELSKILPPTDTPVLFLCRSGARSHRAALAASAAGYGNCFNVLEGFEGDRDDNDHRSTLGGWRFAGLPWAQ